MKKNYFMLAAATMMFAACAETDLVNEVNVEEVPKAIEFESFANKTTRAEITDIGDLQTAGFQVWGYKYPEADEIVWGDDASTADVTEDANYFTVFGGVDVSGANWTYTGTQYWDKTSKYNFYAVAPMDPENGASYAINNGDITITGVTSQSSTTSADYLIAEAVTGQLGSTGGTVDFNFSHIMSKVTVKVVQVELENDEVITLTDLTMSGWNSNEGTFTQNATPEWRITAGTDGEAPFLTGGEVELDEAYAAGSYLMVPQTGVDLTFTISYMIGNETFLAHEGTIEDQTWATNTHYTYTITVGPEAIEFDVTEVNGWPTPATEEGTTIQ